jgi:hypothetical protein
MELVLYILAGISLCLFIYLTYPTCLFLAASLLVYQLFRFFGYKLFRNRTNSFVKATSSILFSVFLGIAGVCLLLFTFNILKHTLHPRTLWVIQSKLVSFRIFMDNPMNNIIPILIILAFLMALTFVLPRLKLISQFNRLKGWLGKALIITMTMTSFTFFSNQPLKNEAINVHNQLIDDSQYEVERYNAYKSEAWEQVGEILAVRYIEQAIEEMDADNRKLYNDLFLLIDQEINRELNKSIFPKTDPQVRKIKQLNGEKPFAMIQEINDQRIQSNHEEIKNEFEKVVSSELAHKQVTALFEKQDNENSRTIENGSNIKTNPFIKGLETLRKFPQSLMEWRSQQEILRKQEQSNDVLKEENNKLDNEKAARIEILRTAFTEVIGSILPIPKNAIGQWIQSMIDLFSEKFVKKYCSKKPNISEPKSILKQEPLIASEILKPIKRIFSSPFLFDKKEYSQEYEKISDSICEVIKYEASKMTDKESDGNQRKKDGKVKFKEREKGKGIWEKIGKNIHIVKKGSKSGRIERKEYVKKIIENKPGGKK